MTPALEVMASIKAVVPYVTIYRESIPPIEHRGNRVPSLQPEYCEVYKSVLDYSYECMVSVPIKGGFQTNCCIVYSCLQINVTKCQVHVPTANV